MKAYTHGNYKHTRYTDTDILNQKIYLAGALDCTNIAIVYVVPKIQPPKLFIIIIIVIIVIIIIIIIIINLIGRVD